MQNRKGQQLFVVKASQEHEPSGQTNFCSVNIFTVINKTRPCIFKRRKNIWCSVLNVVHVATLYQRRAGSNTSAFSLNCTYKLGSSQTMKVEGVKCLTRNS